MTAFCPRPTSGWRRWAGVAGVAMALVVLPSLAQPSQKSSVPQKAPAPKQEPRVALQAAQAAMDRKDYATAATLLENFLLEQPGHVQALFNLAYCYSLLGRRADAIEMYEQTLEVDPKLVAARLNLGLLLLDAQKPAAAAEQFSRALEIEPENPRAHFYAGVALEQSGKKEEALEHYRRAAALDPKQPEPRRALLNLLLEKSDLGEARTVLEELRGLVPEDPELLRLQAALSLRESKPAEALAAYEDYLKLHPGDAQAHLAAGRLYRAQGKPEEALRHFQAAEEAGGGQAAASLQERADTLAALERWSEAIPLYRQAVARQPADPELHASLGFALLKNRNSQEAVPELTRALELDPKRVETYNHLASALTLSGDPASAIQALDRRAAYAAETPGTLFLRARNYDDLKQCAAAIDYYEKFLALNQDTRSDQYFQATARLRLLRNVCRERPR